MERLTLGGPAALAGRARLVGAGLVVLQGRGEEWRQAQEGGEEGGGCVAVSLRGSPPLWGRKTTTHYRLVHSKSVNTCGL